MRLKGLLASTAKILALMLLGGSVVAEPLPAPTCRGQDLLPELAATDPSAVARINQDAKRIANGEALLWRISRPGIAPSHLFGTIHLSDERVIALSPRVLAAFGTAKRVVLEVADVSPQAFQATIGRLRSHVLYEDGQSLNALLDQAEQQAAGTVLAKVGFAPPLQERLKPWFVTLMIALSDCERARVQAGRLPLDLHIADMAKARGVPVLGLETLDDQLLVMANVPEMHQVDVLKATLKSYTRLGDVMETMVQRYLAREMAKVLPLQSEMIRALGAEPSGFASFHHALLTLRNPRMRDAALPILAEGDAFIAVGALHLIGDDGLVTLLRQAGYEVSPVE